MINHKDMKSLSNTSKPQHLTVNDVASYLMDILDEGEEKRIRKHLTSCLACSLMLEEATSEDFEDIEISDCLPLSKDEYDQASDLFNLFDLFSDKEEIDIESPDDSDLIAAEFYPILLNKIKSKDREERLEAKQIIEKLSYLKGSNGRVDLLKTGQDLLARFSEQILPLLLWFVNGKWFWGYDADQPSSELKKIHIDERIKVGGWSLQPATHGATSWGTASQPIRLFTTLPEHAGEITIEVVPERQQAGNREVWNIRFELGPSSRSRFIDVGMGTSKRCTTGTSELRAQRPVKFPLPPPVAEPYYIYFEWSEDGEIHQHVLELPIRSLKEEPHS